MSDTIFKKVGSGSLSKPGRVSKSYFKLGTAAKDRNDYFVYDKKAGVLYYDPDGSGSAKKIPFLKVAGGTSLSSSDLFII
ncbi:hypothetical protein [Microvirga arsenatis]|uniref:Uncharacterized protein n=1 Tax=Microvirga arsenatis TaxID=2692265 RepID=A0ABW9Z4Z4_9HYPH|nr:hypothetical protein [Microvirga arsenatis]NBJ13683.1 hypothetical protein [Microvirga arsenatis]NBJ27167.1 hypothetical protein [Microvirga arsenatis]